MRAAVSGVGPRRLDPRQLVKVTDKTVAAYQLALRPFLARLDRYGFVASRAEERAYLLVEYKNDSE